MFLHLPSHTLCTAHRRQIVNTIQKRSCTLLATPFPTGSQVDVLTNSSANLRATVMKKDATAKAHEAKAAADAAAASTAKVRWTW